MLTRKSAIADFCPHYNIQMEYITVDTKNEMDQDVTKYVKLPKKKKENRSNFIYTISFEYVEIYSRSEYIYINSCSFLYCIDITIFSEPSDVTVSQKKKKRMFILSLKSFVTLKH